MTNMEFFHSFCKINCIFSRKNCNIPWSENYISNSVPKENSSARQFSYLSTKKAGLSEKVLFLRFMNKTSTIKHLLAKPFCENLNVFAAQYLCIAVVDLVCNLFSGKALFALQRAGMSVAVAYIVTFVFGLFKSGKASKAIGSVLCILGAFNAVVDIFSFRILGCNFAQDCISAVAATNPVETKGFLQSYFDVITIGACAVTLFAIRKCYNAISGLDTSKPCRALKWSLSLLTVLSLSLWAVLPKEKHDGLYYNKLFLILSYKPVVIEDHPAGEYVLCTDGEQPDCIVLVIGESFAKSHASTFGYGRNTTPRLDSMAGEGVVFPYSNAFSAWPRTVESMLMMLSSCTSDTFSEYSDRKVDFLLDVMRAAGYRTFWFSNQNPGNASENAVARIAAKADTVVMMPPPTFTQKALDECLLPPIKALADSCTAKCFAIVHMLGQHEAFRDRYPSSFDRFKPDKAFSRKSRIIAEYDNAVLYNDYVVSTIMETFADRDAVVLFVPDHGLDVFESSPHFVGHAKLSDPASLATGLRIPMYVFVSGEFSGKYPLKLRKIRSMSNGKFTTDRLMDYILELAGVHGSV